MKNKPQNISIQGIEINEENFVLIQGTSGNYEVIVWASENDSEGDDGAKAISSTQISGITYELSNRADINNAL
jgi:hypothetical protein